MVSDKIAYEEQWLRGKVRVETSSVARLKSLVEELREMVLTGPGVSTIPDDTEGEGGSRYPTIPGNLGCADAIRMLLAIEWGIGEGRTESELTSAMRSNAIHYSHGTISGMLTAMTQRDELRRVGKKRGRYSYILNPDKIKS